MYHSVFFSPFSVSESVCVFFFGTVQENTGALYFGIYVSFSYETSQQQRIRLSRHYDDQEE